MVELQDWPTIVAVRKAGILVHWVPDVHLDLTRAERTVLQVARTRVPGAAERWLHPCAFRSEVTGFPERIGSSVAPVLTSEIPEPLGIHISATGSTRLDAAGLFRLPFDEHHSVIGFATLSGVSVDHPNLVDADDAGGCEWDLERPPPLCENVDLDLGAKLVSCSYPSDDAIRAEFARRAAFEAMVRSAPEEVEMVAATQRN